MKTIVRCCAISFTLLALISCQSTEVEQKQEVIIETPAPQEIAKPAPDAAPIINSVEAEPTAPKQKTAPAKIAKDTTKVSTDSVNMDPRVQRILDEKLIKSKKDSNN